MAGGDAFVVLDVGTTQCKAVLFSPTGDRIGKGVRELPLYAPRPGVAEQEPSALWDAAIATLREALAASSGVKPKAVSVTSERSTTFLTNADGNPITPALTWMDQRTGPRAKALAARINGRIGLGKIDFLRSGYEAAWKRAKRIHVPHSYLLERLTGAATTDVVNALYLGGRADGSYDEELLRELDVPPERLPQIHRGAEIVGSLRPEAARALGLPPGLPVVCGSGDQQCSSLGLGVHEPGTAKATTGTGTFVNAPAESVPFDFFDKDMKLFATPRATGDGVLLEAVLPGTGSVYRWFRDAFFDATTSFRTLDEEAARVPAGSHGVQFYPLFPFSLGSFQRLGFHSTRGHFLRAILEGSAFGTRFFLEVMQELGLPSFDELRLDGGGANSPLWRGIVASVTRRRCLVPPHVEEASALGAAILSALALRNHRRADEAIQAMVRFDSTVAPKPADADAYDAEYPVWQNNFFTSAAGVEI